MYHSIYSSRNNLRGGRRGFFSLLGVSAMRQIMVPLLLLISALLLCIPAEAKIASGKAHLSGAKTESTLVKFAVSASSTVSIDVNITSYGMYEDEQALRLHIYDDDDWARVRREPLCSEKVKWAERAVPIVFDFAGKRPDDRSGKKKSDMIDYYTAHVQATLDNPPPPTERIRIKPKYDRSRYFYFTIDDCSLERYNHDSKMPDMVYTLNVLNVRKSPRGQLIYDHLPSDEDGIGTLLVITLFFSGALTLLLFYKFALSIGGDVHVAIIVVMAACGCNGMSALCELIHRTQYARNGYGNYAIDALSSYFEALSDSFVALVLLSIGGGWTLPSDVLGGGMGNVSTNKLVKGIRNPAGSLLDLVSCGGRGGGERGGIVALLVIFAHVGLAQWGRTFDDDFDTYHALEHPPGRALMMLRFVLGLVFVTGVGMLRSGGRCPPSLMSFLTRFALVGLAYFASLPGVSMFVGSALPYYQRHQALHWGAALVQACR